jgi:short-subunit dehydrogenase
MNNKTVVITGSSGGLGLELCRLMLKEGALVWGIDRVRPKGKIVQGFCHRLVDITQKEQVESVIHEISKTAPIDVWINNAGIAKIGAFESQPITDFTKVIEINLLGQVNATRLVLQQMQKQGWGTIVNVASVGGHIPTPFLTAYSTSKFAMVGFTRSLREELRLKNSPIKLVLVSPGFVDTPMLQKDLGIFPDWLSPIVSKPEAVAKEILSGLKRGNEEIFPTVNGRLMMRAYRLAPKTMLKGSKLLLADSFKDYLLNRYRTL